MRYLTLVLSVVILYGVAKSQAFDPYSVGPYSTDKQLISRYFNSLTFWNPGLKYDIELIPPKASGSFPVIYFIGGHRLLAVVGIYDTYLKRIASYGYVVVHLWKISGTFSSKANDLDSSITWIKNHLHKASVIKDNDITLDFNLSFGIGFSQGGRILTEYLEVYGCNDIKGIVLLSPVDSYQSSTGDALITDGTPLSFDTPTLILAAGYDHASETKSDKCIPEDFSNYHFYNAINTPFKWIINATEYKHEDFLDEEGQIYIALFDTCHLHIYPSVEFYRRYVSGQAIAFLEGLRASSSCQTYFDYLEDPAKIPITVEDPIEFVHASGTCPLAPYCT